MKEFTGTLSANTGTIEADPNREGLVISNNSDTVMTFRPDVANTATAAVGISVQANQSVAIHQVLGPALTRKGGTIYCAGASKSYTAYSW